MTLDEKELTDLYIETICDEYDPMYTTLIKNWETVCARCDSTPAQIVLVSKFYTDISDKNEAESILMLMEKYTNAGYCIRRTTEFQKCRQCPRAIVTEKCFKTMSAVWNFLPSEWNDCCSECQHLDGVQTNLM